MKKIMLLTAVLILFCFVPLSATQAMQDWQKQNGIATSSPHTVFSVYNQQALRDLFFKVNNPDCKGNLISLQSPEPSEALIAMAACASSKSSAANKRDDKDGHNDKDTWGDAEYYEEFEPRGNADDKRINDAGDNDKNKWGDAEYYEE